jgi:hypothetical protein
MRIDFTTVKLIAVPLFLFIESMAISVYFVNDYENVPTVTKLSLCSLFGVSSASSMNEYFLAVKEMNASYRSDSEILSARSPDTPFLRSKLGQDDPHEGKKCVDILTWL